MSSFIDFIESNNRYNNMNCTPSSSTRSVLLPKIPILDPLALEEMDSDYDVTSDEEEVEEEVCTEEMKKESQLYFAIINNQVSEVESLLASGISPNYEFPGINQWGKSILHLACESGKEDVIKLLLTQGANPNIIDDWRQTPLMYSVSCCRDNLIPILLSYPSQEACNPDLQGRNGRCCLHTAVDNKDMPSLQALLLGGACPNTREEHGKTPLWQAVKEPGNMEAIKLLVESGADVNKIDRDEKRTPLQTAICRGKADKVQYIEYLLQAGCELDNKDLFLHTPLMSVIHRYANKKHEMCNEERQQLELLIAAGCDLNVTSYASRSHHYTGCALTMAIERNSTDLVELLLHSGANPDPKDSDDIHPLFSAILKNNCAIGKLLIAANCDTSRLGVLSTVNCPRQSSGVGWGRIETPMLPLFHYCVLHELWEFAAVLVRSGYTFLHEVYMWGGNDIPENLLLNVEFLQWVHEFRRNPVPLGLQCESYIRKRLGTAVFSKVSSLPIPPGLRNALLMKYDSYN